VGYQIAHLLAQAEAPPETCTAAELRQKPEPSSVRGYRFRR
jgi:hypothetical protein